MSLPSYAVSFRLAGKIVSGVITIDGDKLIISSQFFRPLVEELKSMKGKHWDAGSKTWIVDNCRRNLFAIDLLTGGTGIEKYDAPLQDYYSALFPAGNGDFWDHQKAIFNFVMTRRCCIIAAEMRTGKTKPTLAAVMKSVHGTVWWVAPKSALRGLDSELRKWGFASSGKKIKLMSYERFTVTVENVDSDSIPGFVVFDECQKLKNPKSKRSIAAEKMTDLMHDKYKGDEYVVLLSGTPAPRDPGDWWGICEVACPGYVREGNRTMFERRLGNWEQREGAVGQMYWHLISWKEDEVKFLYQRLNGLVQVHLKKDCLDLPDKQYEIREIEPSGKLIRVAKAIADNAINVLDAINRLRQLSDGFQYNKEYDIEKNREVRTDTTYVGSPKIDELKADLANHEDVGRIIIYCGFQGAVDLVSDTCLAEGWVVLQADGRGWKVLIPDEANNTVIYSEEYLLEQMDRSQNDGTISRLAFVANSDAAGTGLELSASPTIIFYSNSNNGDSRMQAEDRAHSNNMDKNRGLTIIDYCHLPTDYRIRKSLMEKKHLQSMSLGDIKEAFV